MRGADVRSVAADGCARAEKLQARSQKEEGREKAEVRKSGTPAHISRGADTKVWGSREACASRPRARARDSRFSCDGRAVACPSSIVRPTVDVSVVRVPRGSHLSMCLSVRLISWSPGCCFDFLTFDMPAYCLYLTTLHPHPHPHPHVPHVTP